MGFITILYEILPDGWCPPQDDMDAIKVEEFPFLICLKKFVSPRVKKIFEFAS
jgi:hypothetical protein